MIQSANIYNQHSCYLIVLILVCIAFFVSSTYANYSPAISNEKLTNVYWGDTHLHTNLSFDANGMGNKLLTPDHAYQFAKGKELLSYNGEKIKLARPLDFLVVADHGNNIGVMNALETSDSRLLRSSEGRYWYEKWVRAPLRIPSVLMASNRAVLDDVNKSVFDEGPHSYFWKMISEFVVTDKGFRRSVWENIIAAAERHNVPGKFTTFSGYEWTAHKPAAIHRVVIFKDGAKKVSQVLPFTAYDSVEPEMLWSYMASYERRTGGNVLAIPHNSNISEGVMFSLNKSNGFPIDDTYASIRSRWEPLVEVTQIKGDSETHPDLSPKDTFSDYETWNSWYGWDNASPLGFGKGKKFGYIRSSLMNGLSVQAKLGNNPFKFGMIGSTDSHTSLATADENNFWGKHALSQPSQHRLNITSEEMYLTKSWEYSAAGYAGVWAEENTRESLFAAMKRKEVYASTGPRITVRFFGGWDYQAEDAFKPDLARIGYDKGVPMGGDLTAAPDKASPKFLIRAVKDPDGANLDRVQVIKGWHDAEGLLHEKIYNVALSDDRKENRKGKVKPVGNTVDIPDASYTNTIGDPELAVVWEDPDFDVNELAFYYARILEIPTPRWTAYDAKYFKLKDVSKDIPMVTQERAYTSPIWYTPFYKDE